jgi:K+-sensing histidine kinase KdpD
VGEVEIARDLGVRLADALDRLELFERATEATHARDWLLHKVTHDLGNPVASISMATDRMLRAAPTPERRERSRTLLDGVARQAREMELIIEELLDASALRTGRVTVAARAVEPGPLVHDAIALAEMVAAARGVELRAHAPSGSLRVLADPYHIRRALSALISDALGWSRRGGRIGVDVVDSGDEVVFGVTGPGPDVPAEELSRLLDRGQEPGAGGRSGARVSLPLLIASSIVRAHGSRLDAMSTLSGETRYVFALPAAS